MGADCCSVQTVLMGVSLSGDRVQEETTANQHRYVGGSVTKIPHDNGLLNGSDRPQNQLQSAIVPTYQIHDNDAGSSTEIPQDITDIIKTLRQEATIRQKMKRRRLRH